MRLTSGPQKPLMLFPLPPAVLSLSFSLTLVPFIFQDISLSSVPVEQNRVSVPAGDSSEISARLFLGHHMKGSMSRTGVAVVVCVSMFGFLCVLRGRVCRRVY